MFLDLRSINAYRKLYMTTRPERLQTLSAAFKSTISNCILHKVTISIVAIRSTYKELL